MAKINLNNLSPEELEALAKQAKAEAKVKRKQEEQKSKLKLGEVIFKNIDTIINCDTLDINLRQEIAKITGKEIGTTG